MATIFIFLSYIDGVYDDFLALFLCILDAVVSPTRSVTVVAGNEFIGKRQENPFPCGRG